MNGTYTCSTLVQAYMQRIAAYNAATSINSIVSLNPDAASEAAQLDLQLTQMLDSGACLHSTFAGSSQSTASPAEALRNAGAAFPSLFCVPFIVKVRLTSLCLCYSLPAATHQLL